MASQKQLSEGEEFLREFFYERNIKFIAQREIRDLKGDTKDFRVADFYLPKFDMYVEFFGQWNLGEESKQRYREKVKVYLKNNKSCIYFYPENLGIVDHIFNGRMIRELKRTSNKKGLRQFRWYLLKRDKEFYNIYGAWVISLAIILFYIVDMTWGTIFSTTLLIFFPLFSLALIAVLFEKYRKYYRDIDDRFG